MLNLRKLTVGTTSVYMNGSTFDLAIDYTVTQLWLPRPMCDSIATMLNLTFDAYTGLYVVHNTTHERLIQLNPQFTFTLAASADAQKTIDIVLPYAAFDLLIGVPIFDFSTRYFPIRRAAGKSQFVLGRAFLQETYLVVDWERGNFTLGQTSHHTNTYDLVPILSRESEGISTSTTTSIIQPGAIAGIAIGAVAVVVIALVATFFIRRSRRKAQRPKAAELGQRGSLDEHESRRVAELHHDHITGAEAMSSDVCELQNDPLKHQLMSLQIHELDSKSPQPELEDPNSIAI